VDSNLDKSISISSEEPIINDYIHAWKLSSIWKVEFNYDYVFYESRSIALKVLFILDICRKVIHQHSQRFKITF